MANNIDECLEAMLTIDGSKAACIVDCEKMRVVAGMTRSDRTTMEQLSWHSITDAHVYLHELSFLCQGRSSDRVENLVVMLEKEMTVLLPLRSHPLKFIFLLLDRNRSNLAHVLFQLADIEQLLVLEEGESPWYSDFDGSQIDIESLSENLVMDKAV